MPWLSVSIVAAGPDAESLSQQLSDVGAVAVTLRAVDDVPPVVEPGPGETPIWSGARLDALFPVDADLGPLQSLIGDCPPVAVEFVADRDWSDVWRQSVVLQHYAGRLSIVPREHPLDDLAGAVVRLDPGLAFGTGAHATTSMCLEALAARELAGLKVADIGCGSGILTLAALALGADHVLAVDHDPQALLATRDNAAYNGLSGGCLTTAESVPAASRSDLVIANILANPLIEMAPTISGLLLAGGTVVLSGILEAQLDRVLAVYPDVAFDAPVCRDGWVCVEGIRRVG